MGSHLRQLGSELHAHEMTTNALRAFGSPRMLAFFIWRINTEPHNFGKLLSVRSNQVASHTGGLLQDCALVAGVARDLCSPVYAVRLWQERDNSLPIEF